MCCPGWSTRTPTWRWPARRGSPRPRPPGYAPAPPNTSKPAYWRSGNPADRFAVHAATPIGIEAAIEAGADTIEHGLGLRDDHIAAMVERDIILVPTMLAMSTALPETGGALTGLGWNAAAVSAVMASIKPQAAAVRRAWEAGVLVLAGTDAGMVPHGRVVDELRCLGAAGLPRIAVLGTGCWDARRFLGLPLITEGAPADLVLYDADPRERLETLDKPLLRILDGRIVGGRPADDRVAAAS